MRGYVSKMCEIKHNLTRVIHLCSKIATYLGRMHAPLRKNLKLVKQGKDAGWHEVFNGFALF